MATSILTNSSLLLTCLALLAIAAQSRPLQPAENSRNKFMVIVMVDDVGSTSTGTRADDRDCDRIAESSIKGKVAPPPPSPNSSPPIHDLTTNYPAPIPQLELVSSCTEGSPCTMFTNLGKTPKSPTSSKPAPSKHQGTIEQPIKQSSSPPDFQFKSISTDFGKTLKSPPIQQRSSPDSQIASF